MLSEVPTKSRHFARVRRSDAAVLAGVAVAARLSAAQAVVALGLRVAGSRSRHAGANP
jgi:hypothetical protein